MVQQKFTWREEGLFVSGLNFGHISNSFSWA